MTNTFRLALSQFWICLALSSTACTDQKLKAREKLSQLHISYETKQFHNRIEDGDFVAVQLFLSSGMDPNTIFSHSIAPQQEVLKAKGIPMPVEATHTYSYSALTLAYLYECMNPQNNDYGKIVEVLAEFGARKDQAQPLLGKLISASDAIAIEILQDLDKAREVLAITFPGQCMTLPEVANHLQENQKRFEERKRMETELAQQEMEEKERNAILKQAQEELRKQELLRLAAEGDQDSIQLVVGEATRSKEINLTKFVLANCSQSEWASVRSSVARMFWSASSWNTQLHDDAMQAITGFLLDSNAGVRQRASIALSFSGSEIALNLLEASLKSERDEPTRKAYQLAIKKLKK